MRRWYTYTVVLIAVIICLSGCVKSTSVKTVSSETSKAISLKQTDASSSEVPEENDTLTICMVGDVLLHDPLEAAAQDKDGNYNYDFLFEHLKGRISGNDLALVNQEVIIGGKELGVSGYPNFNASFEIADSLARAGFDIVCHATNHVLDKGSRGVKNALEYWEKNHPEIEVTGIHDSNEDQARISVVEKCGIKVAILNYTYGTNGIAIPSDMPYAVDLLEEKRVREDLKKAETLADFTIVCPHWGTEYSLDVDASQKKWTKLFREGGADLVLGTHPHVIEGIEEIQDNDRAHWTNNHGNGDMLVYYSLGNFANWTSGTGAGVANRMVGGMAEITLTRTPNGEVAISDHEILPIVCHVSDDPNEISVYPLNEYTPELGQQNAIRKQDATFSTEYCRELCKKIWGM
ncbi:MAG: CapA family protein [Lachnospiraceae bacterium]|nr:CapA family protein [Lachnospiraceae bacterium]